MNSILICGGAGYIGSHAVKKLVDEGLSVVVVDNLNSSITSNKQSAPYTLLL
ncbi:NAD-dependent epimerase/dehydratase family protein [Bacillus sp. D-CC]